MFLTRLRLRDVRAHVELDLRFTREDGSVRPWTFLLGENGVGKSTVVRALALVLAGSDALGELLGSADAWIRAGADEARITADLRTRDGEAREVELVLVRGATLRETLERNGTSLARLDAALAHSTRNYPVFAYGVHRRVNLPSRQTSMGEWYSHPRANAVATLFARDATLVPLERWAAELDYARPGGLDVVRSTLDAFLPGVRFAGIDRGPPPQLRFTTPDGELPLSDLSDGYQSVAAWCGDLLYRITTTFGDYKDPLKARGLLLIDELALHLHPTWQRRLVRFLSDRLPNMQIVATTHSPLAVHAAAAGEVAVFARDASGRVGVTPYAGSPRDLFLHQLLTSPLFGLAALDSPVREAQRARLAELDAQPTRSRREEVEQARLREELASMPDYRASDPDASDPAERMELLRRAVAALDARTGDDG